jgi:uncharacterized protein (DUF924 family)
MTPPAVADPDLTRILHFWFGVPGDPDAGSPRQQWFRKSEAFDAQIRTAFAALYADIAPDPGGAPPTRASDLPARFAAWLDAPDGALALVVLLDQFPRNMFRDSARAYRTDALALSCARAAIARGHPQAVAPLQRVFFYLPFEHSEDLHDQEQSVALFAPLAAHAELADYVAYARRHRDVIARFGRFPHRNGVLGRTDTEAEREFLRQPGSRF